jgi:hypothetical protein
VPGGPAQPLLEQDDAQQDPDHRVRDRDGRDGRRELPRTERDLLDHEPEDPGDCERVRLPVGQELVDPLVQELERRLRQRRREAEQDARHGSVDGGLHRQASSPAEAEQRYANGSEDRDRDRPLAARRVLAATGRVAEDREERQPDDDHRGSDDLVPTHVLTRQEVAEREREHDRRHEQRLDDRQPSAIERRGLEHIAHEQCHGPHQPHGLTDQPSQRGRAPKRQLRKVQRPLLLQRRRESEQEGGDEGEDRGHRRGA